MHPEERITKVAAYKVRLMCLVDITRSQKKINPNQREEANEIASKVLAMLEGMKKNVFYESNLNYTRFTEAAVYDYEEQSHV